MNVYGRSSAEEAAAARLKSCGVGDGIWSKNDSEDSIKSKEKLPPVSSVSNASVTSSSSADIRNCDDNNELDVFDDDEDSVQLSRTTSESSQAIESYASLLSASNYSFSAAVAPISSEIINTGSAYQSIIQQKEDQKSIR